LNACLIANPAAGRGRGARRLPQVLDALAAVGIRDVRSTRSPGHERDLAAQAAADGIETIVALGGDGTWGNVTRGILDSGRDARLVPIAAGTGNDFPHALQLPAHDPVAMARIAAGTESVRVDVGRANDIVFLNVAGLGLETEVLRAVRQTRALSGTMVYVAASLPLLRSYPGLRASIQVEDEPPGPMVCWCAIVASNGPRFGGGFRVAPGATVTDGKIDLVSAGDQVDAPLRRAADARCGWGVARHPFDGAAYPGRAGCDPGWDGRRGTGDERWRHECSEPLATSVCCSALSRHPSPVSCPCRLLPVGPFSIFSGRHSPEPP
jgi:diacylglycerol kinase (ATP)